MNNKLNKRFFRMADDDYAAFMQAAELENKKGTDVARSLINDFSQKIFLKHGIKPLNYPKWRKKKEKSRAKA